MVLHHVAQRADAIVKLTTPCHAKFFRQGDLHMLYPFAPPQGLKQHIGKTHGEQVLHRFFAQIMVDAVNLVFLKILCNRRIDGIGRGQIRAQRLFQHHPMWLVLQSHRSQMGTNRLKQFRRSGQIIHIQARRFGRQHRDQSLIIRRFSGIHLHIVYSG